MFFKFLLKKHSFFVASASHWRQNYLCRWDEWLRVTIAFRFWPNFEFVFPGTRNCFFQRIWVVRHLHFIQGWILFSGKFWSIATSSLCFQFLLWHCRNQHKMINISQLFQDSALLTKKFSLQKYLYKYEQHIMKSRGKIFFLRRESILLVKSSNYVDLKI